MAISGISNYSYSPYSNRSPSVNGIEKEFGASNAKKLGQVSSNGDCQTCKERKYKDGSDENVSFKSAAHISPSASAAKVMSHEAEHVSNAYTKAAQKGGEVISAGVTIQTASCPECGRSYVSGGETRTVIKYPNETNPYQKNQKSLDALNLAGANVDFVA